MPGKNSSDSSANQVPPSEQPTSVIPFNVDPPSTSGANPGGGAPPAEPPAAPPTGGPGNGGPGKGGPGNGGGNTQPPAPGGLFASNWARLAALVGGIVVAVVLIGGGAVGVAAATGNLGNNNHRASDRSGDSAKRGFGSRSPHGYMGRDKDNSDGDGSGSLGDGNGQGTPGQPGQGQGRSGGQGGLMGMLPGAIGGVEHGDFTLQGPDGKAVTMRMVRGTVTDVTAKAITVKASDGYTVVYALNSATKVSRNGASVAASAVVKGDSAIGLGSVSGKTVTATRIVATSAPQ